MLTPRATSLLAAITMIGACAPHATPTPVPAALDATREHGTSEPPAFPPISRVTGPPVISVVYPAPTDVIDARDSTFLLGSVATGDATLLINGHPVEVWPNGAWLAWIPIPRDSDLVFAIVAQTLTDSVSIEYPVQRVRRFVPPEAPVWIDSLSLSPAGPVWWPSDEPLPVRVRATGGAEVRLRLPGGGIVPLVPELTAGEVPAGIRAFDRDTANLTPPDRGDRYIGAVRGIAVGEPRGPMLGAPAADSMPACPRMRHRCPMMAPEEIVVEAILGADTARVRWPLAITWLDTLPVVIELDDDTASVGNTDSLTVGRARPGATYHWFFPTGTRSVATGRLGNDLRLRLSRGQEAWVPAADAVPLPRGTPELRGTVLSLTATPADDRIALRVPLTLRVPFRVEEEPGRLVLRLYNAVGDVNWIRYGRNDAYIRDIRWLQATSDEVTVAIDLAGPVWGYRARWQGNDLIFEIRRPPRIDSAHPLKGRRIVVDPGHPPAGAKGPTGLREAEANLGIALQLRDLLAAQGAEVIMTRETDTAIELSPRTRLADSVDAEVLVSIHNNALPDGVNPFTNNGSSVFYNHPRSQPLARAIQEAFSRHLPVRMLGVGRGDLALVRPTWMPAVLTEGLFMMLPDQEAALRDPAGQARYAEAVRDGLLAFLADVARGQGLDVP